jgi:hypothetical protein
MPSQLTAFIFHEKNFRHPASSFQSVNLISDNHTSDSFFNTANTQPPASLFQPFNLILLRD